MCRVYSKAVTLKSISKEINTRLDTLIQTYRTLPLASLQKQVKPVGEKMCLLSFPLDFLSIILPFWVLTLNTYTPIIFIVVHIDYEYCNQQFVVFVFQCEIETYFWITFFSRAGVDNLPGLDSHTVFCDPR